MLAIIRLYDMKRILLVLFGLLFSSLSFCQLNFIKKLQAGKPQHIIIYGTS